VERSAIFIPFLFVVLVALMVLFGSHGTGRTLVGEAYSAANPPPTAYAPPWDVFTGEQFLSVRPTSSTGDIKVVVDRPGSFIYQRFYVSRHDMWEPHEFAGPTWMPNHAEASVALDDSVDPEEYVLVYTCQRRASSPQGWDCGCKSTSDTVCRAFAVQSFNTTIPPPPLSPCASFSSCVVPPPGFPGSATAPPFKDVPPTGWTAGFYPYIMTARALGITAGTGNNEFNLAEPTTRGAAAVFLMKAFSIPPGMSSEQSFTDVPAVNPFFKAVESVHTAGLMNGYGDGSFGVDDPLTRAQLAVVVARAMGLDTSGYDDVQTFTDVPPTGAGSWAHGFIEALHDAGLIVGYPDGMYRPTQPATRAQALSVIMKGAFGFKSCENCDNLSYDCDTHTLTMTPTAQCGGGQDGEFNLGRGVNIVAQEDFKHLDEIKQAGFDTVRLVRYWLRHVGDAPSYTIDSSYLQATDTIINNALAEGLNVVMDLHISRPQGSFATKSTKAKKVWEQLAEHYKAYPPNLVFEPMNEPTNMDYDQWNGLLDDIITIIREKNPTRQIMVTIIRWWNLDFDSVSLPSDDANIIMTFHTYYPGNFTQQGAFWIPGAQHSLGVSWGTEAEKQRIINLFDTASAWKRSSGRELWLGEFGTVDFNTNLAERARWTQFVRNEAEKHDIPWAVFSFSSHFGVYDTWKDAWIPELLEALIPHECSIDKDDDGFGAKSCGGSDCDDTDFYTNPYAADQCGDGVDQNCDGSDNACRQTHLIWHDEFDGSGPIDPGKWGFAVGTNPYWGDGLQYYTNRTANVRQEGGHLRIESRKEEFGGYNYTSARISTRNRAYWRYGRVEVRAKLPGGRGDKQGIGMKSAIWMMPQYKTYGKHNWPDNGEIDIMENVGWNPTTIFSTVHRKPRSANERVWSVQGIGTVTNPENNWHTYWMEWTPENMTLGVDDQKTLFLVNDGQGWEHWPFDQPFYLILSHPVADSWSTKKHTLPFDDSILPQQMLIDYVRVYQECAEDADCPAGMTCNGVCVG